MRKERVSERACYALVLWSEGSMAVEGKRFFFTIAGKTLYVAFFPTFLPLWAMKGWNLSRRLCLRSNWSGV